MHCKNLYEQKNVRKMRWYESLAHKPSLFTIEDICIGLKKLATRKVGDLQGFKA